MTQFHPAELALRLKITTLPYPQREHIAKKLIQSNTGLASMASQALVNPDAFEQYVYGYLDVARGLLKSAIDRVELKNTLTEFA